MQFRHLEILPWIVGWQTDGRTRKICSKKNELWIQHAQNQRFYFRAAPECVDYMIVFASTCSLSAVSVSFQFSTRLLVARNANYWMNFALQSIISIFAVLNSTKHRVSIGWLHACTWTATISNATKTKTWSTSIWYPPSLAGTMRCRDICAILRYTHWREIECF